jgi:hypothetical protein
MVNRDVTEVPSVSQARGELNAIPTCLAAEVDTETGWK